jgi:hypothetical protein
LWPSGPRSTFPAATGGVSFISPGNNQLFGNGSNGVISR